MDWLRLNRALEADRVEQAEVRRQMLLDGRIENDAITDDEWAIIAINDRLLGVD